MEQTPNSDQTSEGIRVQAAAQFLEHESDPDRNRYLYVYRVRMVNDSDATVQLRSRHWIVLDAHNRREEFRGDGVVGKQPLLAPGEKFEYTSHCPLRTEWGTMEGTYTFSRDGATIEVPIGRFFLVPSVDNALVTD